MRSIPTLLAVIIMVPTLAQPVLNSTDMQAPGHSNYYRFFQNTVLPDTTVQGPNATWDCSGLLQDGGQPEITMTFIDPATTPNGSQYPTSNYAWWEMPSNVYRYFELTPTFMQRVGSYSTWAYTFADPQVEYVFPMTLGTTNTDTWWGVSDGGEYRLACIGTGTLILPGITVEDALLVRARITGTSYLLFAYLWYSSTNGSILMQYIPGPISPSRLYLSGTSAGIAEQERANLTVLGNPVTEAFRFVSDKDLGPLSYRVYTSFGGTVAEGTLLPYAGAVQSIATDQFAPGVYMVQLSANGTPVGKALRFVRE